MKIAEQDHNGVIVLVLEGRIDTDGAVQLDRLLHGHLGAGRVRLALDMGDVQYINSSALRSLADVITETRARDGDLKLVALTPRVRRVLQIVGFDRYCTICATLPEALEGF